MKVFIVEDSTLVQGLLTNELSAMEGVSLCGMADNPDDALRDIRECGPDLIVLDIVLNDGNGFQVLKGIREDGSKVRIMVITNYAFPHYGRICKEMGADFFFDKSMELEKAIQEIKLMAYDIDKSTYC